jgi:hypothetical protein
MSTPEETASQLEAAQAALEKAQADHATALAKAEDSRAPELQMLDLLELMVMRFGNRPQMRALINRLRARLTENEQPAASESEEKAA